MEETTQKPQRLMLGYVGSNHCDYEVDMEALELGIGFYPVWTIENFLYDLIRNGRPTHLPVKPEPGYTSVRYMPIANAYLYLQA
jgi:hypothetical protein